MGKRGKLYAKCSNLKSTNKKLKPKSLLPVVTTSKNLTFRAEDDAEQCIKSLKYDNLSSEDFDLLWQACSQYRLLQIRSGNQTIKAVFEKWPQYKLPSGNRLIDNDFKTLHPENEEDILDQWPNKFAKILKFLKEGNRIKSSEIQSILTNINEQDFEKDESIIRLLWCIHCFLVPTQKTLKKDNYGNKQTTKYTITDSQETFVYVAGSLQEIDEYIRFLLQKGENIQPFILAIGHLTLSHFEQFFIYIDGVKLRFKSILRAVDVLFKMFYVFNLQYPIAGEHFWTFIEKFFYNISESTKNKSSKVCFMIDELNKC